MKEGQAVFGILASWDEDTVPSMGGTWNDLLVDRELVVDGEG